MSNPYLSHLVSSRRASAPSCREGEGFSKRHPRECPPTTLLFLLHSPTTWSVTSLQRGCCDGSKISADKYEDGQFCSMAHWRGRWWLLYAADYGEKSTEGARENGKGKWMIMKEQMFFHARMNNKHLHNVLFFSRFVNSHIRWGKVRFLPC